MRVAVKPRKLLKNLFLGSQRLYGYLIMYEEITLKFSDLKQQLLSLTVSVGQEFRSDLTDWLRILPEGSTGAADHFPSSSPLRLTSM